MGYADPETPTTSATAALPFLLLGEPDKPLTLKRGLLLLVLDSSSPYLEILKRPLTMPAPLLA